MSIESTKASITRDRVVLVDPVIQALRKQRCLIAIYTFDKAPHPIPRSRRGILPPAAFLHSQGHERPA
jgi:hypothetical protein